MGLDNAWVKAGQQLALHFDPELTLCGGMFSGHGDGSFRGKVYDGLVRELTGVSLYEERIPNGTVRAMADKLAAVAPEFVCSRYRIGKREFKDLQRMFLAYAEADADLVGWW